MRARWVAVLAAASVVAGCANAEPAATPSGGEPVTVLAAASLTESFTRIGADFEAAHPGTAVTFSFGGSSGLAQQITAGAPADVFAAASPATMSTITDAGAAAGTPATFARNQLVIAVAEGNPHRITGLSGLSAVKVAVCAPQVPCGTAAATVLTGRGVTPVTREQDVRAALAKVRLGEVDAALVYRTDARAAASDVDGVEFPESARAVNDYPIVALAEAPNAAGAAAFVAYVRSGAAQRVLADAGFQRP
jgi:molybdate transport system substrate-binding protein